MFAYVGCYTTPDRQGRGEGITVYRVDEESAAWTPVSLLRVENPSFLALHPNGRTLYAVHGGDDFSHVSSYTRDLASGELTFSGRQPVGGRNPVHLDIEATGRLLVVASYADGTVTALPLAPDGVLGPHGQLWRQSGPPGPHPAEQASAHPHHCPFDPSGQIVAVPDKGLDRVFVYRADAGQGTLTPATPPFVASAPGAGPRHIAFHPHLPLAYVVNELDSTVTTYAVDVTAGTLTPHRSCSTLPPDVTVANTGSEIAVAPSGHFLYLSNRGHDSIASFAIDPASGELAALDWTPAGGRTPRHFALDPAGRMLCVANQGSDAIVAFRVDQNRGTLTPTGQTAPSGSPACIVFASA